MGIGGPLGTPQGPGPGQSRKAPPPPEPPRGMLRRVLERVLPKRR